MTAFHVGHFESCAVLESSGEFGLAPYPEMSVLGMLVIWQSFILLS